MLCKILGRFVYDNATASTVTAGGNVPLPNSTVTNGCVSCDGSNITISRGGTYLVTADFTFVATATGVQETQMYRGGNAALGAHAIDTVAAVGDYVSQSFSALVTVPKNAPLVTLNFKSTDATSVRVANVIVSKTA